MLCNLTHSKLTRIKLLCIRLDIYECLSSYFASQCYPCFETILGTLSELTED
ncbi:hypothetical protein HMPREF0973_00856 [Prevotella veroralis F0319]|uniref:Uncharacterized protein n=1 Tax=Prevotella veroralis F0319 TaxID=649761 RepID=C9MMM4_9BACT|nr:hypothetical protein HMPREF0973_00856 [Prevotella veroralis F0319]